MFWERKCYTQRRKYVLLGVKSRFSVMGQNFLSGFDKRYLQKFLTTVSFEACSVLCCGIFHCVWNISTSAGSTNNQDCIFHFFRFISFVHSYITIVLNVLLKITMLTSFMVTTSKRLNYVCPAANRTWQRLTIICCDLKHERDTYFLNISHIIYLNYYLPRINRLQSKPLTLIKTNRVNSIIRHRMWLYA